MFFALGAWGVNIIQKQQDQYDKEDAQELYQYIFRNPAVYLALVTQELDCTVYEYSPTFNSYRFRLYYDFFILDITHHCFVQYVQKESWDYKMITYKDDAEWNIYDDKYRGTRPVLLPQTYEKIRDVCNEVMIEKRLNKTQQEYYYEKIYDEDTITP